MQASKTASQGHARVAELLDGERGSGAIKRRKMKRDKDELRPDKQKRKTHSMPRRVSPIDAHNKVFAAFC